MYYILGIIKYAKIILPFINNENCVNKIKNSSFNLIVFLFSVPSTSNTKSSSSQTESADYSDAFLYPQDSVGLYYPHSFAASKQRLSISSQTEPEDDRTWQETINKCVQTENFDSLYHQGSSQRSTSVPENASEAITGSADDCVIDLSSNNEALPDSSGVSSLVQLESQVSANSTNCDSSRQNVSETCSQSQNLSLVTPEKSAVNKDKNKMPRLEEM